jgi:hypothetical protein
LERVLKRLDPIYEFRDVKGRFNDFRVSQAWASDSQMSIVDYVNNINVNARITNARYDMVINLLVGADSTLKKDSREWRRWAQFRKVSDFRLQAMLVWACEDSLRSRALIRFLFRCYVKLFHVDMPAHEVVARLYALRLRDTDGANLGEMHSEILDLFQLLDVDERARHELFESATTLMRHLLVATPKSTKDPSDMTAAERERHVELVTRASKIENHLAEHIQRFKLRDANPNATGEELDGYLNEAIEALQKVYGKGTTAYRKAGVSPSKKQHVRQITQGESSGSERPERALEVKLETLVKAVENLKERSSPEGKRTRLDTSKPDTGGTGGQPADGRYRKKRGGRGRGRGGDARDDTFVVNAGFRQRTIPTPQEAAEHTRDTDPNAQRRCFVCGSTDHNSMGCDCAFRPGAIDGIGGKFSLGAFIDNCIAPFNKLADSQAEFARRTDALRHHYDYTGTNGEGIVRAATRWKEHLPQIEAAYQAALLRRKYPP